MCELSTRRSGARRPARVRSAVAGALTAALLMAGCGAATSPRAAGGASALVVPQTPPVALAVAERGDVVSTEAVAGQVDSLRTARLYFHNGGTVALVNVVNGQEVRSGEVLASLDLGGLMYQIDASRLAVEKDRLALQGVLLGQDQTPAATEVEASQQFVQREQAELQLQQDEVSLESEALDRQESEVTAPFTGEVNDVSVAGGDQVSSFQTVMTLSDPSQVSFVASVGSVVAEEVRRGDVAVVRFNVTPGAAHAATVESVFIPTTAQIAQADANGVPIPSPTISFAVPGLPTTPALGATFSATITRAESKDVVYVPNDAIRQFSGFDYVDVLNKGAVAEVPVQIGLRGNTTTAVLKGLAAGEQVVQP